MHILDMLVSWEKQVFLLLNSHHSAYGDALIYLFSAPQTWFGVWLAFILLLFYKKPAREAVLVIIAMGLTILICDQLTSHIIKPLCMRPRPTHYPGVEDIVKTVYNYRGYPYGFVSSHAANFFGLATFTALLFKNRWYSIYIFLIATAVCYTRIYMGVHFITDIVPGAIIGILIGWLIYLCYKEVRIRWLTGSSVITAQKLFGKILNAWMLVLTGFIVFCATAAIVMKRVVQMVTS
ncbi:phosphatase PAP2 family protein [Falsiporphyromonas endometrii]|uniref:Phosphatase PAP2 family protein n=1 Tax=Falsiporphyromonas endometrii TaxID=1387297 RepID=A0ABV9K7V8_9PORP